MKYRADPKVIEEGFRAKEKLENPFRLQKFEYKTVTPDADKEVYQLCARFGDQKVIQRDGFVATEK